jgi:pimeloyl-ACP methyl ester carboxylesterase
VGHSLQRPGLEKNYEIHTDDYFTLVRFDLVSRQCPGHEKRVHQNLRWRSYHYIEAGEGRAIVLIPGWRMPAWIWQKQIDELSKKYRVIAVDPRSQGKSDKPASGHLPETRARDYKELVDQLGLKQPVLIGWSMGCGELPSFHSRPFHIGRPK